MRKIIALSAATVMSTMSLMLAGAGVASASPCTDRGGFFDKGTCIETGPTKPPGNGTKTTETTGAGGGGGEASDTTVTNHGGHAPGGLN
ncbi:MAG: hypothetical protein QOG75_103 [Mycobacterium sp.]|jgi:hypothetical protein|nr:hypothetical protein [Mycobacterium sp.]